MQVGSADVLLPTTMVGNYPNPRWYDGRAFAQFLKGEFVCDAISREDVGTADELADRIRQVLEYVPAERLGLSTDCGLINLLRTIAASKLRALGDGAAIVRAELAARSAK